MKTLGTCTRLGCRDADVPALLERIADLEAALKKIVAGPIGPYDHESGCDAEKFACSVAYDALRPNRPRLAPAHKKADMLEPGDSFVFDNNEQTQARGLVGREGTIKYKCVNGDFGVEVGNLTTFARPIDVVKL